MIKEITPLLATGLYNELLVALRLTSDHMKFMRMYVDPTEVDAFIRTTEIANELDDFRDKIKEIQKSYFDRPIFIEQILELIKFSLNPLKNAVELEKDVTDKAQQCKAYVQIEPDDIRHLRRETDFFLGIFDSIIEQKWTKDAITLGIPIGIPRKQIATAPRVLIDKLPIDQAEGIVLAWAYFWSHQNEEHVSLLKSLTRPEDTQLIDKLNKFEIYWKELFELIVRNPKVLIPQVTINSDNWNDFLTTLLDDIRSCKIREGFPQRLIEHMKIENELLVESVARFLHNTQNIFLSPEPEKGAVYDQFPSKDLLLE